MIRLYLKILENFVSLIFQDGLCVEYIPLVPMVKFKRLEQFPMDHLAYPIILLFICLIFGFTFTFLPFFIWSLGLRWQMVMIICIQWVPLFFATFERYFSRVSVSYRLDLKGMLLTRLFDPFLIIPRAPTITGTVVILRCNVLFDFYF